MAYLLPILSKDVKHYIAEIKYKLETKSYNSFFEDFVIDIIRHQATISEDYQDESLSLFPIVSENYNIKITYKPTGLYVIKNFTLSRCSSTSTFDNYTIKRLLINNIHRTVQNFKKGEWKSTNDSCGRWYYSTHLGMSITNDKIYQEWKKLTEELQSIMMNKFNRFIEIK